MAYAQLTMLVPALLVALASPALQKPSKGAGKPKSPPPVAPPPPAPPPRLESFPGALAAAKALALERNVPLLAHIIIDGEDANDRYRQSILPNAELIAASPRLVVVVANDKDHPQQAIDERAPDGTPRRVELCSAYGTRGCGAHQAAWRELTVEFVEPDGMVRCPQLVVFLPDGKVLARFKTGEPPAVSEILASITEAQASCGAGMTDAELAEARAKLAEAQGASSARRWPAAVRALQEVVKLAGKAPLAARAREGLPAAEKELRASFDAAAALLVPGTVGDGCRALDALRRECAGLAIEAEIAARIDAAAADKALRAEVAAWRISVEAAALLAEARATQATDPKKARAIARKLFQKRFAATKAAEDARKEWPDVAAEEDERARKKTSGG